MNPIAQPEPPLAAAPRRLLSKGTPSLLIENHDEAYYIWRERGIRNATLVHVDAHHDMWPAKNDGPVTVGNYVSRAMNEGIVGDIYWVVPDDSFASDEHRDLLLRNIERLPDLKYLKIWDERVTATYAGHRLVVCRAKDLPELTEQVLLDVDVDYFVLPIVSAPETAEVPRRTPWAWPEELLQCLAKIPNQKIITVAYSVNGGTTPLRWKYLGEELNARFSNSELRYFEVMRNAEMTPSRREEFLQEAISLWPAHAAAHWHLAETLESRGLLSEAQDSYKRAMACDQSYSCIYANEGPCLEAAGRWQDARDEYQRLLRLDQDNPYALLGLGSVAATQRDWQTAQQFLRSAIERGLNLAEAQRLRGDACLALDEKQNASSAYEDFCARLKGGERSLATPIASRDQVEDVYEVRVRARMAQLYSELGDTKRATEEFRWLSTKLVPNTPIFSIRLALARLLWQNGQRAETLAVLFQAAMCLPTDVARGARKLTRTSPATPLLNIGWNVARGGTGFMCSLATSVILARSLGPEAMGIYGYTLWIAGVMIALCHFGLPTALSRFAAERLAKNDRAGAAQLVRRVLIVQIGIIIAVMGLGAVALIASGASKSFPWLFAVLLVAPMAMQQAFIGALMGAHDYGTLAFTGSVGAVTQLGLVCLAARSGGSVRQFLLAIIIANVITAALYWRRLPSSLSSAVQSAGSKIFDVRALFRFTGPVAYLVILDMVVWQRSETFFLRRYSMWQEVGFYSIAYLIVSRLNETLVAATSTLMPLQTNRLAASGKAAVAEMQWKSLRLLQMLLVPVCILAALLSKPVITMLYGEDYLRVWPVLLVLLLSPAAVCMTDVSIATLYALERQRSLVIPLTFTAALNIALAFFLVPRWGAVGAAAANSAAQLAEGTFLLMFSAAVLAARVPWRSLITIYAAGVSSFLPAALAAWVDSSLAITAGLSAAGCLAYLTLLLRTRELPISEWQNLRAALFRTRRVPANA